MPSPSPAVLDDLIARRAFADTMRAWSENSPDPEWFEDDCLNSLLTSCGEAGVLIHALLDEITALRADAPAETMREPPRIEFHQQDWIPGFAAFLPGATTPSPKSRAFCVLNLGSLLAAVQQAAIPASDLPYIIAESMMHEIIHVIEQWAGAEFSEERVEALLAKYVRALPTNPEGGA